MILSISLICDIIVGDCETNKAKKQPQETEPKEGKERQERREEKSKKHKATANKPCEESANENRPRLLN